MSSFNEVIAKLQAIRARAAVDQGSCVVGYAAAYALPVHENLEARHKEGKQAKFLTDPLEYLRPELVSIVRDALRAGKTLMQALLLAGLRLERESQQLVPILTGNLRASAFVRLE